MEPYQGLRPFLVPFNTCQWNSFPMPFMTCKFKDESIGRKHDTEYISPLSSTFTYLIIATALPVTTKKWNCTTWNHLKWTCKTSTVILHKGYCATGSITKNQIKQCILIVLALIMKLDPRLVLSTCRRLLCKTSSVDFVVSYNVYWSLIIPQS